MIITHPLLFFSLIFIIGTSIGSFLNVVIYRLPIMLENQWKETTDTAKINLAYPTSHCPSCNHKIAWYENIPLLSFVFLKGKCSNCHQSISIRYPMIELITGLLSIIVGIKYGVDIKLIGGLLLLFWLISLFMIDLDTQLLPDDLTLSLLWIGLLFNTQNVFVSLSQAVYGAIGGYLTFWSVYQGFKLITKKEGMGYGDFKLLAALGAWFGIEGVIFVILSSVLVALFSQLIISKILNKDIRAAFAFGPYLAIAGVCHLLIGKEIISWYLSFWHI